MSPTEVVVDGLPLFGGAQLAVDTTLVCALHRDGTPVGRAAETDGVALKTARRRKERRYPELLGRPARAKLVVLAVEVGGKWSEETRTFLSFLAKAKVRCENHLLRNRVQQAWRLRWGSLLSCTTACAVASSMLELPRTRGADGTTPALHTWSRISASPGLRREGERAVACLVKFVRGLWSVTLRCVSWEKKKQKPCIRVNVAGLRLALNSPKKHRLYCFAHPFCCVVFLVLLVFLFFVCVFLVVFGFSQPKHSNTNFGYNWFGQNRPPQFWPKLVNSGWPKSVKIFWPKSVWPKSVWPKSVTTAKIGLGLSRSRPP